MIKRTLDISEPSYLKYKHKQLVIDRSGTVIATIPFEDIGIMLLHNPAIAYTHSVLVACSQHNIALVVCDATHTPCGQLVPFGAHHLHTRTVHAQVQATAATKKRLWQAIVQHKIREQAHTLKRTTKQDVDVVKSLVAAVKSGDVGNVEANAARLFFPRLFGADFRRQQKTTGINSALNYGYMVMRAMIARALCGTGLHPAFGVQHTNQYNAFCLADDVMEPLRPWVDERAYCIYQNIDTADNEGTLTAEHKKPLLGLLGETVMWKKHTMPLMVACNYLAFDIKEIVCGERAAKTLVYPKRLNDSKAVAV